MKNELTIYNDIDKQLQMKSENRNVFPLSPTHRKEIRQLKSSNIGDLRHQLSTIEQLTDEQKCLHICGFEFGKCF